MRSFNPILNQRIHYHHPFQPEQSLDNHTTTQSFNSSDRDELDSSLSSELEPDFIRQLLVPSPSGSSDVTLSKTSPSHLSEEQVNQLEEDGQEVDLQEEHVDQTEQADRPEIIHQIEEHHLPEKTDWLEENHLSKKIDELEKNGQSENTDSMEQIDPSVKTHHAESASQSEENPQQEKNDSLVEQVEQETIKPCESVVISQVCSDGKQLDQSQMTIQQSSTQSSQNSTPPIAFFRQGKKRKRKRKSTMICGVSDEEEAEGDNQIDFALSQDSNTDLLSSPPPLSTRELPRRRRFTAIPSPPPCTPTRSHDRLLNLDRLNFQQTLDLLEQLDSGQFLLNQVP